MADDGTKLYCGHHSGTQERLSNLDRCIEETKKFETEARTKFENGTEKMSLLEASGKSAHRRLDDMAPIIKTMGEVATQLGVLSEKLEQFFTHHEKDRGEILNRIDDLEDTNEKADKAKIDRAVQVAQQRMLVLFSAGVGALISFIASHL